MTDIESTANPGGPLFSASQVGEGLRATYFHLGVIRSLRKLDALSRISHIVSVSGGSITAAHLFLRWTAYTGPKDDFIGAQNNLLSIRKQDLRGRAIRRSIIYWPIGIWNIFFPKFALFPASRADFLEEEYRNNLGLHSFVSKSSGHNGSTQADEIKPILGTDVPRFYIMAQTKNRTNGILHARRLHLRKQLGPLRPYSLHSAVAASSSFPPVFATRHVW